MIDTELYVEKLVETSKSAAGYGNVLQAMDSLPNAVWILFGIKFLESFSFFVLSYGLVIFLSGDFGLSDSQASWAYGIYGTLVSVYGLAMGVVIDSLGVRQSLLVGLTILIASRLVMATTTSLLVLLVMLGTLLPVGAAMTLPLLQIGIKRYTTDRNRSVAFTGLYVVMNLSAMTAAPCIDAFHRWMPVSGHLMPGVYLTPYRMLIIAGGLLSCASLYLTYRYVKADDPNSPRPAEGASLAAIQYVLKSKIFWRFTLLAILLVGVRSIYRHLDATFPKFMLRNYGADAPYGSLIALNPLCVVLVAVLAAPLAMRFHPVPMIIFGSFISAIAPFALAAGHTYVNAVVFVLILSVGEGLWSPRMYEYSVMIAEKGREGVYTALAAAPMFLSTLLTGATSGVLLERYSPEQGERRPEIMWAIIGLISFASPVLMLVLRNVIERPIRN